MADAVKHFQFDCGPDAQQYVSRVLLMDMPTPLLEYVGRALEAKAKELGGKFYAFYIPIPDQLITYMK